MNNFQKILQDILAALGKPKNEHKEKSKVIIEKGKLDIAARLNILAGALEKELLLLKSANNPEYILDLHRGVIKTVQDMADSELRNIQINDIYSRN